MSSSNEKLTQEELEYLQVLQDPVLWAQAFLNWEARWYQEGPLRDESLRIVLRMGRRIGKSEVLAIRSLHAAFTKPGRALEDNFVVLIIAPYESQVRLLFERMRDLILKSEPLKASVVRDVASPNQEIRLANGAIIRGFTAGSSSGKGAANIRGQRADLIILDEVDYMADKDIINIMALPTEDPNRIKVISSSTPTGRRGPFYRWCQDQSTWSHYHHASTVNPQWNDELEAEFRAELSELGYLQEIGAEFGEERAGVFQKRYLDYALKVGRELKLEYRNDNPPPKTHNPRVLGVDWDTVQATPSLMGYEWNRELGLIIPIYKKEIPRTEFSLDAGVEAVIDSHLAFDWDYIYVDRGYGQYQVETLKKFGILNPETQLQHRVIGVTFSDSVNVPDPHTKKREKKPLKPFAVNNFAVMLERGQLALCPGDVQFIRQLENYRVESVGPSGQPRYTDIDEHFVDATSLALFGLIINYTDISKVRLATAMAHLPKIEGPVVVKDRSLDKKEDNKIPVGIGNVFVVTRNRTGNSSGTGRGSSRKPPRRPTF